MGDRGAAGLRISFATNDGWPDATKVGTRLPQVLSSECATVVAQMPNDTTSCGKKGDVKSGDAGRSGVVSSI